MGAVEEIVDGTHFGVLLLSRTRMEERIPEGWKFDSMFQWIGYNLKCATLSTEFPTLGF
jgi:hypothetical protein